MSYILSIDQGTSGTKAVLVDKAGQVRARGSVTLESRFFGEGFVEQQPESIYNNLLEAVKACLQTAAHAGIGPGDISAIGISNQRETFLLWDRQGQPLCPAIVWQCRRSVGICNELRQQGHAALVQQKTGLVIDPYFSATKLVWLLRQDEAVRKAVQSGDAFFGTVDSWLLFRLTDGKVHATDHSNASRTLFFNIHTCEWDQELLALFECSRLRLPEIKPAAARFGTTRLEGLLPAELPITAMIGDSHAAAFGAGCFDPGTAKATLGTGCSILMNIGSSPVASANGMVTTICWSLPGRIDYALEGVIVTCGATIEWLKNELELFRDNAETAAMAQSVPDNGGVYLIPAFSGLGSPHWQMDRKASISGMRFDSSKAHIVRAALESIPYQIKDVIAAMEKDTSRPLQALHINGGASSNSFVTGWLAALTGKPLLRSERPDDSALGAAYLAGLGAGIFSSLDQLRELRRDQQPIEPCRETVLADRGYRGWQQLITQQY
ncbi:glycerol kinase GlpK [Niabella terrae]